MTLSITLLLSGACSAPEAMDPGNNLLRDSSSASAGTARATAGTGAPAASGAAGAAPVRRTPSAGATPPAGSSTAAGAPTAGAAGSAKTSAGVGAPAATAAGVGGSSASAPGAMVAAAGGGAGTGAMTAAAGAGGGSTASGPSMGTLTLKFTTKTYDGFYGPLNYGAVWFESADGDFIKTVKRWAGAAHASDLSAWTKASGGWGSLFGGGGNMADMMDAMSSATLRQHESHTVMWSMKDADKMVVPDGDYVAVVELTEDRAAMPGPILRVPFKKGPEPQMIDHADEMSFTDISLAYQP